MLSNSCQNLGALKSNKKYWHSNGKLLLTGEYLVLEGATALAFPVNKGQSLQVFNTNEKGILQWKAVHESGHWFYAKLSIPNLEIIETDNKEISKYLVRILKKTRDLNLNFLVNTGGLKVETKLEFLPQHGLGSSSTLINNLAKWAEVDAYELQKITFGGSGYDIACANNNKTLFFKLSNNKTIINETVFNPSFSNQIYFVYLGKKQKSLESIKDFRQNANYTNLEIEEISKISKAIVDCQKLDEFDQLIETHEEIMSKVLSRPTIKQLMFSDFEGSVKSLGGWGGDFVMMTSKMDNLEFSDYLATKDLDTFYTFNELLIK